MDECTKKLVIINLDFTNLKQVTKICQKVGRLYRRRLSLEDFAQQLDIGEES